MYIFFNKLFIYTFFETGNTTCTYTFNISIQDVKKNPSAEQILDINVVTQGIDDLFQKRETYSLLPWNTNIDVRPVILPVNLALWPVY